MKERATILVVDDNEATRYSLAHCLRHAGHEVREASTGEECLRFVANQEPDLVLLDVKLPDMSGIEVCRRVKAQPHTANIPVIQISAFFTGSSDRIAGLESGAEVYLTTPFQANELLAQVNALLRLRRAEAALNQTAELNRRISEIAPCILYIFDLHEERNIWVNRQIPITLGYDANQVVQMGSRVLELLLHPEDRGRYRDYRKRLFALKDGETSEFDYRMLHANGSWVWLSSRDIVFLREPDGSVRQVMGAALDITNRRQHDELLQQTSDRLRSVLENSLDAAYRRDLRTDTYDYLSPVIEQVMGIDPERMRTMPLQELVERIHPDDFETVQRGIEEGMGSLSGRLEYRFRMDSGDYRWVADYFTVQTDAEGKPIFRSGIVRDISEHKKAGELLVESEQRLRLAQAAARFGVFDRDLLTGATRWDQRIRELWGIRADDPVDYDTFLSGMPREDRALVDASIRRAMDPTTDGTTNIVYRVTNRADKRTRWIAESSKVYFQGGRPVRIVGAVQDVTEQHEFQDELERLVGDRTSRLQELVADLEHFSYTITHDMRAPLRAMRGFAEVLNEMADEFPVPEMRDYVQRIMTSAERMDLLITDALSYSKAVRQELTVEPVDVNALLRGMLDTYPEFQSDRANIELDGPIPCVMGNEAGLTQCFSNLLGNAVKFVAPGKKPKIRIWAELRAAGGRFVEAASPCSKPHATDSGSQAACGPQVRIWVEDEGIGISENMLPRIFQMFSRGSKQYEGTGIGLALVGKVAQRMGGLVGVESKVDQGSRFWIELPAAPQIQ